MHWACFSLSIHTKNERVMCFRFAARVHMETKSDPKKVQYIEVSKPKSPEDMKRKLDAKKAADHVSVR